MATKWYERQLRIHQTVLREPDVVNYDADAVVAFLEKSHCNCFVINGGGIVDFFRHSLEMANPNAFLGTNQDLIRDITRKCHDKGIRVIVRVDFRGVEKRFYEQHPDWFALDQAGKPILYDYLGAPLPGALYSPCYLSHYRNAHAYAFADDLLKRYDIDGIWENAPFQHGVCYCRRCRTAYREDKGKELPRGGDFDDTSYDTYRVWKGGNLLKHFADFQAEIKKYGDDKIFCAEIFGLFYEKYRMTSTDLYAVRRSMDFMVTPLFVANHEPLHAPATLIKFLTALDRTKTPVMLFGHQGTDNQLRYVSNSPAEAKIWMWQAVSAGGSLWDCTFNGQHPAATHDRRNAWLPAQVFAFMEANEDVLHHQRTLTEISILYLQASDVRLNHSDRSQNQYLTHLMGLEQVLLDLHLQYDYICNVDLSLERLKDTRVLAIPNGAVLSDTEMAVVRAFVSNGGKLLATHQTSLLDKDGVALPDFGLGDVFGCSFTGVVKDTSRWGYQRLAAPHPISEGLDGTELVPNWGDTLLVRSASGVKTPLTYVPTIYPQPPERSWLPTLQTEYPTVVVNTYGNGECIYFASGIDRNVVRHGHPDFSKVLGNAVKYLVGEMRRIRTNAPSSLQLALTEAQHRPGTFLLHAINVTSAPRRPVTQVIPVRDIDVQLRLPAKALESIKAVWDEGFPVEMRNAIETADGGLLLDIHLPQVSEYLALRIDTQH